MISACIIARDEAASIARCIASASVVADEVVVYDTGSVDETVLVARAAGAAVAAGAWPGGFAAARNAAAAHCRGDWVLSLDADEELCAPEPGRLRRRLAELPPQVGVLQLSVDNETAVGLGSGYAHTAGRVFRRAACEWRGRLHEQLVDAATGQLATAAYFAGARIRHHGYLDAAVRTARKLERNLELARAEVADPSFGDRGIALVMLGRALWAADRPAEALEALRSGAAAAAHPGARRQGLASAARILLRLGRPAEASEMVAQLRAASRQPVAADVLAAGVHLAEGRFEEALALLGSVAAPVRDDDGYEHSPQTVAEWRAAALVGVGAPAAAADLLLGLWRSSGKLDADLSLVAAAAEQAGRPFDDVAQAAMGGPLEAVVAATLRLAPKQADGMLEALWRHALSRPDAAPSVTVLMGAALLGRVLPAGDAARWSARLRANGLGALCPLTLLAADRSAPPRRRAAAALQAARLGDGRSPASAEAAGAEADRAEADSAEAVGARVLVRRAAPASPAPEVSVVLRAAGGAPQVLGCLQAVAAALPESRSFELVAVDAGSTDATEGLLGALGGDVVVVRTGAGASAASARNEGAAAARGRVLVFVESTARPGPGWLDLLLSLLESCQELGAAVPVLAGLGTAAGFAVRYRGQDVPFGGLSHRPWERGSAPRRVVIEPVQRARRAPARVDAGLAVALAVRREALAAAGGFDEGYWNGGEDIDLCFALRHHGWGVACQPAARVALDGDVGGAGPYFPWAQAGAAARPFERAAGPWWQWRDNEGRFVRRWGHMVGREA